MHAALCCAVLCYAAMYCAILHFTMIYYNILRCTALYYPLLYCTILVYKLSTDPLAGNGPTSFFLADSNSQHPWHTLAYAAVDNRTP